MNRLHRFAPGAGTRSLRPHPAPSLLLAAVLGSGLLLPARANTPLGLPGSPSGFTTIGPSAVPSPFGATSGYGVIPPTLQYQDPTSGNWISVGPTQTQQLNQTIQQAMLDFLRPCSEDATSLVNGPPAVLDPALSTRLTEVRNGLVAQGAPPTRVDTLIALLPKLQTPSGKADPLALMEAIDAFNPILTDSPSAGLLASPSFQQVHLLLAQSSAALTGATPPTESCAPTLAPLPPPRPIPRARPIRGL